MSDIPRVTVLTSVFNGLPFFDRAIPSILEQTYKDFEFLIVDDGSTDGTAEMLEQVAGQDSRIRVLMPGRIGFSRALNFGLARAKGEYIARQDFDDISYPLRLERQMAFLDSHPKVGLVGAHYVVEDESRNERYVRKWPSDHKRLVQAMSKAIPFAHTLVMLRKEALVAAGGIAEVETITDLKTWIRIAQLGWELANVPEILGVHYVFRMSHFHQAMRYRKRQRVLAGMQMEAIMKLGMAPWRLIFPASRLAYAFMPNVLKRFVRRRMVGSTEEDLD